jgi:hypothetical protein
METTIENTGLTYREYCFEIEPILNEITGTKSTSACVTLVKVPTPANLKAEQVSLTSKEVRLTWSASNAAGYNVYRDDIQINTELVTSPKYTDVAPAYEVEYTYHVYGVANTGAESENGAEVSIILHTGEIPVPQNVKATQEENKLNVSVVWDAITLSDVEGYNIYRNDEKLNAELVTETEYSDNVPAEGNYCYKVTVVIGGESDKSEPACVDVTVGISETSKDALFTLYPNPVSGTLNINTKETITDCRIFNVQGQLMYSTKSDIKEITTDGWASGTYIIRITTEKGSAEKRFIKN